MIKSLIIGLLKSYVIDQVFQKAKTHLNFTTANYLHFQTRKKTTIRLGHVKIKKGPIPILVNGEPNYLFNLVVVKSIKKRFKDLTTDDAKLDGFNSVFELKLELERCYGRPIYPNDKVTQIFLRPRL